MSSVLLDRPGAAPASAPDDGVALHYGDPLGEQAAWDSGAAVVDRSHRAVVQVAGPDRLTWLHDLTSQFLRDLPAGTLTQALILSPTGHVEHYLDVVDDGESAWLAAEPGTGPALAAYLDRMRFLLRVTVTDRSHDVALLSLRGPSTALVLSGCGLAGGVDGDGLVGADQGGRAEVLVGRERLGPVFDRLVAAGARPAGMWAHEAMRVAGREPRLGVDTDQRTIPNETAWLRTAVHLAKGCYRGQETVARVDNLGRPPRRLALLHLDGSADRLAATGAAVQWEQAVVGRLGTVAQHHELGPIALGLLRRNTPVGEPLTADGVAVTEEPEPEAPEAAPPRSRPELLRLRR